MDEADIDLVDAVYATTTGEGTFNTALQMFLRLQGDFGSGVFHYDTILDQASDLEVIGLDEGSTRGAQEVFDNFIRLNGVLENPLITSGQDKLMSGEVLVSDQIMSFSELSQTEYYKAVFAPLGIRRSMGWIARGRGQKWITFTTARNSASGAYQKQHVDRCKLFQRHMARAIHITELLDVAGQNRYVLEQSIERLPQGIILLDDARRIIFRNSVSAQLIASSNALSDSGNVLAVGCTAHERSKFEHWWQLLATTRGSDGACYRDATMDPVWEIEASRISPAGNQAVSSRRWMLTLKQRPGDSDSRKDYLMHRFGLTQSEADVCIALCVNGDAVSTATALGLSPNTIRAHLKSAFRKTGTRNQVTLAITLMSER